MRDRKGQEASPQNGPHHVQANTRRDRNGSKRCLRNGGHASLPGEDQKARIGCAQVSRDREREPGLGCEPKAGKPIGVGGRGSGGRALAFTVLRTSQLACRARHENGRQYPPARSRCRL